MMTQPIFLPRGLAFPSQAGLSVQQATLYTKRLRSVWFTAHLAVDRFSQPHLFCQTVNTMTNCRALCSLPTECIRLGRPLALP